MAYFGILKAEPPPLRSTHLSAQEVENCAKAAGAAILIASPRVAERLGGLPACAPHPAGSASRVRQDRLPPLRKSAGADEVASVLFTSGTTGKPKGVLLTHRNFRAGGEAGGPLRSPRRRSVLSVLPLHHTFEFSCGLLVPSCSERRSPTWTS